MLDHIEGNGVRLILVEDASRFARDLMVQEMGLAMLVARDVRVVTAGGDDMTDTGDATRTLLRQIIGAAVQFEKNSTCRQDEGRAGPEERGTRIHRQRRHHHNGTVEALQALRSAASGLDAGAASRGAGSAGSRQQQGQPAGPDASLSAASADGTGGSLEQAPHAPFLARHPQADQRLARLRRNWFWRIHYICQFDCIINARMSGSGFGRLSPASHLASGLPGVLACRIGGSGRISPSGEEFQNKRPGRLVVRQAQGVSRGFFYQIVHLIFFSNRGREHEWEDNACAGTRARGIISANRQQWNGSN